VLCSLPWTPRRSATNTCDTVQFREYQPCLVAVPFGKRLPTALYVFRGPGLDRGAGLNRVIAILEEQHRLGAEFNVIKFRTDELKVSFLSYPHFMEHPHPALLVAEGGHGY